LLQQGEFKRQQPLFWHLQRSKPIVALRDGDYSLVAERDYELTLENKFDESWIPILKPGHYHNFQLFNLEKDRSQTTDISAQHPEIFARLKEQLYTINDSIMADGPDWHLLH
ncbi:MAG: arylsulfatase, partial [Verrucomicrobiae bacterium]|nr:arylsulfatase [Verrucomicrobiae bacterium]